MASPLLETRDLCKSFGALDAVADISLALRTGELHAVIGPNGAGKSTLVNLLAGELPPTKGRILVGGEDVTALAVWQRARLGVARSFQRTNIFPSLTVLENVRLAAQAVTAGSHPLRRAGADTILLKQARAALLRAGLEGGYDRIAGTLAHGQQRQLEIAMTLAGAPRVLLLDEPLAGMGPEEGQRMAALLKGLAKDHAVLLIEHDMDFVFQVADRMTVMVEGRVIASGPPVQIRADAEVRRAYLGEHA